MAVENVLTVGQAVKSTGDSMRIPCDFGDIQAVIDLLTDDNGNFDPTAVAIDDGFTVTTSGTGAPTITGIQKDTEYQISAIVSGGSAGTFPLTYSITLLNADETEISRTGILVIKG